MNVTIPLPTYRSHKLVQALKIGAIIPNPRGVELHFEEQRFCPIEVDDAWVNKHAPQSGGYLVVYPDGYRSWSPAEAFEAGHTPVHGGGIAADAVFERVPVNEWAARIAEGRQRALLAESVTVPADSYRELLDLAERGALSSGVLVPADPVLPRAAQDVLAERRRQVEAEGWTPEHDDQYRPHLLSGAAGCYAMHTLAYPAGDPPPGWPFDAEWWKPSADPRRNLVKAAALLLAEIERIDRAAERGDA